MSKKEPSQPQDSRTAVENTDPGQTERLVTLDLPATVPVDTLGDTLVPPEAAPHTAKAIADPHATNWDSPPVRDGLSAPPASPSLTAPLSFAGTYPHSAPATAVTLDSEPPSNLFETDRPTLEPSAEIHASQAPTSPGSVIFQPHQLPDVAGYEVLKELGRGGMGVVYKARDRKLNRIVALKMILAGQRAGSSAIQRFHAEAEAVARFQHPNIVQVYEIGQHGDQPYFSLEFVEGGPLSDRAARSPQPPKDAARLVQHLAEAMDYAHRRGILHRDLKPANILLGGGERLAVEMRVPNAPEPPLSSYVPKITDFGLAKELEGDSGQTRDGAVMGTPSDMAPEQAKGKIKELGPPADVYSLGAILYELLTGVPPFLGTTVVETLPHVVERDPLPPRRMQPQCPHDLQTITLKCLEKEARKRYGSAGELAEDLRRYCDNEPILARPTTTWERAWKWARRRPAAALLALVSVLALLGIGAGGMMMAREAEKRQEIAEKLAQEEETRRRDAEENARKEASLRETADRERTRAEQNFTQARSAVQELILIGQQGLAHEPHLEKVRKNLLNKALGFHQEFLRINGANPARKRDFATAQLRVAQIESMLGQQVPAEKAYRASAAAFQELLAETPGDRTVRLDQTETWNGLAILLQELKRPGEAGKAFDEAVRAREKLHQEQADAAARFALASGYNDRGNYHMANGRMKDAEQDHLRALPLAQQLHEAAGSDEQYRRLLAHTHFNLSAVWSVGDRGKAEEAFGKSVPLWQALKEQTPESPHYRQQLAAAILNRGSLRHLQNRPREAENDYHQAGELLAELADQFRSAPDYRRLLANADGNHGELLKAANKVRGGEKVFRRLVTVLTTLAKEYPEETPLRERLGRGHNDLAISLFELRRHSEAEQTWREAIVVQQQLVVDQRADPANWHDLLASLSNLADALASQSASAAAEKARREAVAAHEKRVQAFKNQLPHVLELAEAHFALGRLMIERKEPAKALLSLHSAMQAQMGAVISRPDDSKARQTLTVYSTTLIEVHLQQGGHAAASSAIQQLLALPETKGSGDIFPGEKAAVFLVQCLTVAEKEPEKLAYGKQAIDALRRAVRQGYKDRKALESGPEFAPLRQRQDFQQLLKQAAEMPPRP